MTGRDPNEPHRAATPLELLFDLSFVVAIASAAAALHHDLVEGLIAHGLVNYALVFFAIWWPWMNFTWFASAYDTDDVQYRLLTFVQIAGVLIVASQVQAAFNEQDYSIMVVGYIVMRIALVAQWLRAAREDPGRRSVALRFAVGIALIQVAWVLRLLLMGWSDLGYLTFIGLGLLELAIPAWAERAGPETPWHPGHIAERYGLFTIIVLGECILATTTAVQVASDAGAVAGPLLVVAGSGLVLVFGLWWAYFKREPDIGHHRGWATMIGWGYGHYFVFAALAALGAGLQVAVDTTHEETHLDATQAAATVAVPVVVYLIALAVLHGARSLGILGQVVGASVLVLIAALAAPWIGVPGAVFAMAVIVAGLVAINIVTLIRRTT